MDYEVIKVLILVFLFAFASYAIARAFWIFGVRGKAKSFGKFWGAVLLLFIGIVALVSLVILSILF